MHAHHSVPVILGTLLTSCCALAVDSPPTLRFQPVPATSPLALEVIGPGFRTALLESSTDLMSWEGVSTVTTDLDGRGTFNIPPDDSHRFFRARLEAELSYVPGRVLFRLQAEASGADIAGLVQAADLASTDTIEMRDDGKPDAILYVGQTSLPVPEAVSRLLQQPGVAFAAPDFVRELSVVTDDPEFTGNSLWGMYGDLSSPANAYGSQAAEAWARGYTGSPNVVVAVIDDAIQTSHPDLAPNIWTNPREIPGNGIDDDGNQFVDDVNGWDFMHDDASTFDGDVRNVHGTHVSGIVGARGNNGLGVVGINWSVGILPLQAGVNNQLPDSAIIAAIRYAVRLKQEQGVNIVALNCSFASRDHPGLHLMQEAVIAAAKQNILVVCGASNWMKDDRRLDNDQRPIYPANFDTTIPAPDGSVADYDAVISVAAINARGGLADFSHYGQQTVDLGAPGVDILSTIHPDLYGTISGTSMAAPHVAGAVALYASTHPGASAREIREAILSSVAPSPSLMGKTVTGGRLDLSEVIGPPPQPPVPGSVQLLQPECGQHEISTTPHFKWSSANHAVSYLLRIYGATGAPLRTYPVAVSTEFRLPEGEPLEYGTLYQWTVAALNAAGQEGPSPTLCSFTVRAGVQSVTQKPTPLNPVCGVTETSSRPAYRWTTVPHADSYVLRVYLDDPSQELVRVYRSRQTVFRAETGDTLESEQRYLFSVAGQNGQGEGPASDPCGFLVKTGTNPPSTGTVPCDAAVDRVPCLQWDPVPGARRYTVQIAADTPSESAVVKRRTAVVQAPLTQHCLPPGDPLKGPATAEDAYRKFYWRVQADDGRWGRWCEIRTQPLEAPVRECGANPMLSRTPTFTWTPVPWAHQYRLQLSVDQVGNIVEERQPAETGTSHTFQPALREGRPYFWRVRGERIDASGRTEEAGQWSAWCAFTTETVAPIAPDMPSVTLTGEGNVRVEWGDNSANEDGFVVERRRVPDGEWVEVPPRLGPNNDAEKRIVDLDPRRGRSYCYRVGALWPGSPVYSGEKCITMPPTIPVLVHPKPNQEEIRRNAHFIWEPVLGADKLIFELGADTEGNITDRHTRELLPTATTHAIDYEPPLAGTRKFFWRIRAEGAGGKSESPWSSFKTRK
ncbi:MAG: S8 family serine peptidase [Limisphaerales bacterium]